MPTIAESSYGLAFMPPSTRGVRRVGTCAHHGNSETLVGTSAPHKKYSAQPPPPPPFRGAFRPPRGRGGGGRGSPARHAGARLAQAAIQARSDGNRLAAAVRVAGALACGAG